MGHVKFISGILMTALFIIAIILFAFNFAVDNEAPVNLQNDTDYVNIKDELTQNLSQFTTDAASSSETLASSTLASGDTATATGGQFKVSFGTSMNMVYSALKGGYKKIFGSDTGFGIFLTALTSLLVYIGALYIYKAWIGSNPE